MAPSILTKAKRTTMDALPATARTRLRLVRKAVLGPLPAPPKPKPVAVPKPPAPPRARQVTMHVPATPGTLPTVVPRELHLTAPAEKFVPKVLQREDLAGYEATSFPHFLASLSEAPAGAVLDIGANVGPYSLLARTCSDREVVGFEPTPDLAHIARVTGARNGIPYLVEEIALGDAEGTATLYLSDTSDSSNSLNPDFRPNHTSIEVPLETLDAYVARTGIVPAVLKVDTETTEPAVLRGAKETIARHRPWVFCEVLHGRGEADLTAAIIDWGYTWYHLTGDGPLEPLTEIVGDATHKHYMFLFVPEPLGDAHWELTAAWRDSLDAAKEAPRP